MSNGSQILNMINQGLSPEQVADTLGIDLTVVGMALQAMKEPERIVSVEELVERYRPTAIKVLADIMINGENESAKVKAAQIIYEGKGTLPDMMADKFKDTFDKMKLMVSKYNSKIIDLPIVNDKELLVEDSKEAEMMAGAI